MPSKLILLAALCATAITTICRAQEDGATVREGFFLPLNGRVTDGENKMTGCEVVLYKGNERISSLHTDKAGKFKVELELNETWAIEFHMEGFVAKRMVFDTHLPKVGADDELVIEPMSMEISMLERARYNGANTDELDFPFAMVKWDKTLGTFAQDHEYTMGMQRTNGALLLMAARSDKK